MSADELRMRDEVADIIAQLQVLHVRESELLGRLEEATTGERGRNGESAAPNQQLVIGDKVIIKNPRPFQAKRGTIVKVGARITVLASNGTKVIRAASNLIRDNERN